MYVIFVVPADIPVTAPVPEFTVPTAVLLLLHVPPPVLFASVDEEPLHIVVVPVIAAGLEFRDSSWPLVAALRLLTEHVILAR